MQRTLLILSPSRVSTTCVERALSSAERAGRQLAIVYVLDSTLSDALHDRMRNDAFVGDAPSERFLDAVREEYRRRANEEIEQIELIASERGIETTTEIVEGEFLRVSLAAAERLAPEEIFVARQERPALSRLVIGSDVKRLERNAECDVKVYRPDDGSLSGIGGGRKGRS